MPARKSQALFDMKYDPLSLQLYKSHREFLVIYAARVGDPAQAEDVVQEAWIQLARHPDPTALREPIAYFKRIVRNLVIDCARRRRREHLHDAGIGIAMATVADDAAAPDRTIAAQDDVRLVMMAIDAMPARQRTTMLYHFDGLKLREIAEKLGISRSLVHLLIK